jgi:hypothetical protein
MENFEKGKTSKKSWVWVWGNPNVTQIENSLHFRKISLTLVKTKTHYVNNNYYNLNFENGSIKKETFFFFGRQTLIYVCIYLFLYMENVIKYYIYFLFIQSWNGKMEYHKNLTIKIFKGWIYGISLKHFWSALMFILW